MISNKPGGRQLLGMSGETGIQIIEIIKKKVKMNTGTTYLNRVLCLLAFLIAGAATAQPPVQEGHGTRPGYPSFLINPKAGLSTATKDVLFYEDWSSGDFGDWTVMGDGIDNWYINNTNQAGGEVPEAQFYYSPIFNPGTSRLVSPVVNTTGYSEIGLSFKHVLDLWSGGGGFWVSVETTSDGGTTWNQVWVDGSGNTFHFKGKYQENVMQMYGESTDAKGQPIKFDMSYKFEPEKETVRQVWKLSTGEGAGWQIIFDGTYKKKS